MRTTNASFHLRFVECYAIGIASLVLLLGSTGCGTLFVTARAKGDPPERDTQKELGRPPEPARPGYWALLPLAVAYDLATSPIQIPMWLTYEH